MMAPGLSPAAPASPAFFLRSSPRPRRAGPARPTAVRRAWLALGVTGVLGFGLFLRASEGASPERKSASGVTYRNERVARVPWSIHVTKVDLTRADLTFVGTLAGEKVLSVASLSRQARSIPTEVGRAVAGVNGDFYERDNRIFAGDPRGLQIVNGELVSAPSTVCVWFDAEGKPHLDEVKSLFKVTWPNGETTRFGLNQQRRSNMAVLYTPTYGSSTRARGGQDLILEKAGDGPWLPLRAGKTYRARVHAVGPAADDRLEPNRMVLSLGPQIAATAPAVEVGAVLEISTATSPDLERAKTAIGGGPALIRNGQPFAVKQPPAGDSGAYRERSKYERHPRAAVGWNGTDFFFVEVDGRQPGLSVGMTLAELGEYLAKLGCTEAMNFDGGASATMWVLGQIVNSPCQGEKPVANALFVVRRNPAR